VGKRLKKRVSRRNRRPTNRRLPLPTDALLRLGAFSPSLGALPLPPPPLRQAPRLGSKLPRLSSGRDERVESLPKCSDPLKLVNLRRLEAFLAFRVRRPPRHPSPTHPLASKTSRLLRLGERSGQFGRSPHSPLALPEERPFPHREPNLYPESRFWPTSRGFSESARLVRPAHRKRTGTFSAWQARSCPPRSRRNHRLGVQGCRGTRQGMKFDAVRSMNSRSKQVTHFGNIPSPFSDRIEVPTIPQYRNVPLE
jgi:hypothetical protein